MLFEIGITLVGAPIRLAPFLVVVGGVSVTLKESFIEYSKFFQSCMSRISLNLSLKPSDLVCWTIYSNASSAHLSSNVSILMDL